MSEVDTWVKTSKDSLERALQKAREAGLSPLEANRRDSGIMLATALSGYAQARLKTEPDSQTAVMQMLIDASARILEGQAVRSQAPRVPWDDDGERDLAMAGHR